MATSGALLAAGATPQIISGPLGPYLRLDLGIAGWVAEHFGWAVVWSTASLFSALAAVLMAQRNRR